MTNSPISLNPELGTRDASRPQAIAVTQGHTQQVVVSLEEAATVATEFARASKSAATRRAYQADAANFAVWCQRCGVEPLPASVNTVAAYLASLARSGLKASTITRRCAGIRYMHRMAGIEPPMSNEGIKAVLAGIKPCAPSLLIFRKIFAVCGIAPCCFSALQARCADRSS
jgi:hypothetical protein